MAKTIQLPQPTAQTTAQQERASFSPSYKDLVFIEDVVELETLKVGSLVELAYLGPSVYEGRIEGRHAFMTRRFPNKDRTSPPGILISSFRGEEPFLTRNGHGLLDFLGWPQTDVYSPDHPNYQAKLKLCEAVGQ